MKYFVLFKEVIFSCSNQVASEQNCMNDIRMLNSLTAFCPHSFIPCSERIHVAVTEMAALFPKVMKQACVYFI